MLSDEIIKLNIWKSANEMNSLAFRKFFDKKVIEKIEAQESLIKEMLECIQRHINEWLLDDSDCMKCNNDHPSCEMVNKGCDILKDKNIVQKAKDILK